MNEQQHPDLEISESSFSSDQASAPTGHHQSQASGAETQSENRVLGQLKVVVWAVFASMALGFGAVTYGLTRKEERDDFITR